MRCAACCGEIAPRLAPGMRLALASKGFELATSQLPHQIAQQELGAARSIAVLSGPTFAHEVGAGLPSAMTIASPDAEFATALAYDLSAGNFRAYTSADIVGVEVGGAVKNVLAVATGFSDGLKFGANTRVAIITRGLGEMTRLGVALGRHSATPSWDLPVLGDLVLTCTDDQSRNRRFGLLLARSNTPEAALQQIGQIVEGYIAAKTTRDVAARAQRQHAALRGRLPSTLRAAAGGRGDSWPHEPAGEGGNGIAPQEAHGAGSSLAKPILAPRLVDDEGHRICKIEAAVARSHGNHQASLCRDRIDHRLRQTARLRAKEERIAAAELRIAIAPRGPRLHAEHARMPQLPKTGGKIGVHDDRGELGIVQARAPHALVTQVEAARPDKMQRAARIGTEPDDVTGVGRNLRLQ